MTDQNFDATAEWLESRDSIVREIERDGDSFPIEVQDITQDELEALEDRAAEDPEAEAEVIRRAIDEYLIRPDVDPSQVPMSKRQTLWFAMQMAWSGIEDIQAAMDELEIPGNRR